MRSDSATKERRKIKLFLGHTFSWKRPFGCESRTVLGNPSYHPSEDKKSVTPDVGRKHNIGYVFRFVLKNCMTDSVESPICDVNAVKRTVPSRKQMVRECGRAAVHRANSDR